VLRKPRLEITQRKGASCRGRRRAQVRLTGKAFEEVNRRGRRLGKIWLSVKAFLIVAKCKAEDMVDRTLEKNIKGAGGTHILDQ